MDKIELLKEEKQNFHVSSNCFCQYCGDTGFDFHKVHTNYLCQECYSWAKAYELEEPTYLEFISYPEYVQKLILNLNDSFDIVDLFGGVLTTNEEKNYYFLKTELDYLKSLIFKNENIIKNFKIIFCFIRLKLSN